MTERNNTPKTFSLESQTIEQIDRIAELMRWDKSTVVEAAVEELAARLLSQPQPLTSVADAMLTEKAA